ncbi:MAG: non-ribosomal peptide synthetase [Bacteroidetes bacterium]|nr:non-ribosomal peptide synthetase [Bacteroidota bacterium]
MKEKLHFTESESDEPGIFWKERIENGGCFYFTELKPELTEKVYGVKMYRIPDSISSMVRKLTDDNDSGLFVFILAAVGVLLRKYTGQDNIVVNTPLLSNHTTVAFEQDIPIVFTPGGANNRQFLNTLTQLVKNCYRFQDYPLYKVTGKNENILLTNVLLTFDRMHSRRNMHGYDLIIRIKKETDLLGWEIEVNKDSYQPDFVMRFSNHLSNILGQLVNLDMHSGSLQMTSSDELVQLMKFSAPRIKELQESDTVVSLFEQQVLQNPHAVAVGFGQQKLTYGELNQLSGNLANHLINKAGIRPGDVVALLVDNSERTAVAIMGILKAGATYLPVDGLLPDDRKEFMLTDSGAKLIITESVYYFSNGGYNLPVFLLDMELDNLQTAPVRPLIQLKGNLHPYIIYTSGTTGRPKGVITTHIGLLNMVNEQIAQFGISDADVVLQFASLSFDASVSEIFTALCSGARLEFLNRSIIKDAGTLISFMKGKGVTVVTLPPSYLGVIAPEELTFLRVIISAGEKLNTAAALQLSRQVAVFNAYGPTEYTVCTTINKVMSDMKEEEAESIGLPIANTAVYITDPDGLLVPPGIVGELLIGGTGLASYLHAAPHLLEKFIDNKFNVDGPPRLYRTGDYARWLSDGKILFEGRRDDQIKLRGFRIELKEVENAALQCTWVKNFVVLANEDAGAVKVIAFAVLQDGYTTGELQKHLASVLPDYMMPAHIRQIDAIPLTNSGKTDKGKLKMIYAESYSNPDFKAPRNQYEARLADIWKKVLGTDKVGINDNFFDLGGDSLAMIRMISVVKEEFSLDIAMNSFFDLDTIEKMADYLVLMDKSEVPPQNDSDVIII